MKISKNLISIFSLFSIQGANIVFPLIIFPYLLHIYNIDDYSKIAVSEVVTMYLLAICMYSFDIDGIKELINGKYKNEKEIFFHVTFIRVFILFFSSLLLLFVSFFVFNDYFYYLLMWLPFPLGFILQSNYYYQARENSFYLSVIVLFARGISVFVCLFFLNESIDAKYSILLISMSYLFSGILSYTYILIKLNVRINDFKIDFYYTSTLLKNGFYIFLGNISVSLYRTSNVLILAAISTPSSVAIYSLAEKVIKALQALSRPLNQYAQTKINLKVKFLDEYTYSCLFKMILKSSIFQYVLMLIVFLIFYISTSFFNFDKYISKSSIFLIIVMFPALVFGLSNFMFGTLGMNITGNEKYFFKVILITGISSVIVTINLVLFYNELGAAIGYTVSEMILLILFLRKYLNNENEIVKNNGY